MAFFFGDYSILLNCHPAGLASAAENNPPGGKDSDDVVDIAEWVSHMLKLPSPMAVSP